MNKLVNKRVQMNLYPFRQSAHMLSAFQMAAFGQGWTADEIALVANQIRALPLKDRFEILNSYCSTYAEDILSFTDEDIRFMLSFLQEETHYLFTKDVKKFDEYDWSTFNSLKRKATRSIKRVFAHFNESTTEEEKYSVKKTTNKFYDTLEEALDHVPAGQESNINIYPVWIHSKQTK